VAHADDFANGHRASHCYFKQQPQTKEELWQAIEAIRPSCCGALCYGDVYPTVILEPTKARHRNAYDNADALSRKR
jgi:hypothetical protein